MRQIFTAQELNTMREAVMVFGEVKQLDMVLEEMAELQVEIMKYKRGRGSLVAIAEELADLANVLNYIEIIMEPQMGGFTDLVDETQGRKLKRVGGRVRAKTINDSESWPSPEAHAASLHAKGYRAIPGDSGQVCFQHIQTGEANWLLADEDQTVWKALFDYQKTK